MSPEQPMQLIPPTPPHHEIHWRAVISFFAIVAVIAGGVWWYTRRDTQVFSVWPKSGPPPLMVVVSTNPKHDPGGREYMDFGDGTQQLAGGAADPGETHTFTNTYTLPGTYTLTLYEYRIYDRNDPTYANHPEIFQQPGVQQDPQNPEQLLVPHALASQTLVVTGAAAVNNHGVSPFSPVTIDPMLVGPVSSTPTFSGTASGFAEIEVNVVGGSLPKPFRIGAGLVSVTNGRWSVTVPSYQALEPGNYTVFVSAASSTGILAHSWFTVQ